MFLPVTSSQVFTNPSWSFLIFLHSRKRTCPAKDEHILGMKESTTTHVVDPVEMKRMTCQTQGEDTCSQTVQQVKVLNLFKSLSASLLFMTVPQTFSVNVSKSQQKLGATHVQNSVNCLIYSSADWCLCAGMKDRPPVAVCDLAEHVERLKAHECLRFSQEYEVNTPRLHNTLLGIFGVK